jgi:polar amino acid transport system substrate-binding protein
MKTTALLLSILMLVSVCMGLFSVATAETAADGPVMTKIKSSGKLVVGTEAQYAPYEFKNLNAEFVGCDMFLAQKIADALGVKLEIVDMSFDGIIPAVQAGQVDLGIAAFTNTPERAQVIDFSDLYETSLQYLVVAADKVDTYTTKESLAGLKVGAQRGTIQSQLITSALPDSQLFELDKYPELALEATNGNIAGLVVDSAVGDSIVATSKGALAVAKFEFTAEEASFGKSVVIPKGNEDLVTVVNEVIAQVLADGSYQAAYDEAVALAKEMGL